MALIQANFRIPEEEMVEIRALSIKRGKSINQLFREAIEGYLKDRPAQTPIENRKKPSKSPNEPVMVRSEQDNMSWD